MAIKLYSGLPGSGKTLSLVSALVDLKRDGERQTAPRPVYAYGIAGLREGLALPVDVKKAPIRNPNFGEVDEPEYLPWWAQLPHGSIICIDEVQDLWPTNRLTGSELEAHHLDIFMLTKHRHWGYDFLLTSQKPAFLHKHARELVDEHKHIVRRWNGKTVDRYTWQEGQEDVKSRAVRALAQRERWKYPKECFPLYRSSTVHTMKRKLPWQYFLMIGAGVLAVPMIWYAVHRIVGLRHLAKDSGVAAAPVSSSGRSGFSLGGEKTKWATVEDYVKDHIPRVANQPWSAPVFDQEAIAARPDLLCIEYHQVINGVDQQLCSCYTEQVTPYDLHSLEECRRYARHGVYNPRRPPVGSGERFARDQRQDQQSQKSATGGARAEPVGDSGAWQPAWRTRAYVQPEQSKVTASVRGYQGG